MKVLVLIFFGVLCALDGTSAAFCEKWKRTKIRAKYSPNPLTGYYNMPLNSTSKLMSDYVKVDDAEAVLGIPASLWCLPNDPRVCTISDLKGQTIGVQISFLDQDTKDVKGYDFSVLNSYMRTNIFGQPAYSLRVYYTDPGLPSKKCGSKIFTSFDTFPTVKSIPIRLSDLFYAQERDKINLRENK